MASRIKAAAAQQAKDAVKAPAEKKVVRPREDPIARAERLLEEARAKAAEAAKKQMTNAKKELALGEASLVKAMRVYNERRDRVILLETRTGEAFQDPADAATVLFGLDQDAIDEAKVNALVAAENQEAQLQVDHDGLLRLHAAVFEDTEDGGEATDTDAFDEEEAKVG